MRHTEIISNDKIQMTNEIRMMNDQNVFWTFGNLNIHLSFVLCHLSFWCIDLILMLRYFWRWPIFVADFSRRMYLKDTTFGALTSLMSSASHQAPLMKGLPISGLEPSLYSTSTRSSFRLLPAAGRRSICKWAPVLTLYCFPPVSMIANIGSEPYHSLLRLSRIRLIRTSSTCRCGSATRLTRLFPTVSMLLTSFPLSRFKTSTTAGEAESSACSPRRGLRNWDSLSRASPATVSFDRTMPLPWQ